MFDGMDEDLDDLQFGFDDEDDDLLLAGAVDEASVVAGEAGAFVAGPSEDNGEDLANISFGIGSNVVSGTQHCDVSGFDRSAGQLWIYPTNYPVRDYQYNIVQQALHRNTLVVLPTGLGKTFIAAVLMYNMYRWFPQGKVVFMAPTKPLVAQQINACYTIVGIPKEDTVEMTGNMNPVLRERMWRQKRVIFLTPQVMTNDLSRGSFSGTSIKCLVVDEAHKAVGNHSYCQVVQGLLNFTQEFRVLALSATPGSDLKGVQQVMCNLLIAHIELRSEESIDIRPYTHERKVDKIVVPMGEELSGIRLKYIQIMEIVVNRLINQRVLFNREATKLSKFLILKARDEYRQNPPSHMQGPQFGAIEADFATAMSLYHGFELLQLHGLRSLYNYLLGIQSGDKGYGRTRYELCRNPIFIEIMEELQGKFALKKLNGPGQEKDAKMAVGHPKMQRLEEIVVEHFKSFQEKNMDTRVMIFSQYRDSVEEIRNILNQHRPLVKAMMFIGQSSVGKSTKGYTQKEQLEVMKQFREGGYNTLVSTCVGEEGLDIGDVDLIVCFDAHKSPIRLVQRMGRTGRKRTGRIVMLVTKGKEEQIYNQSLYSKKSIHKAILNGARTLHFYPHNPPLIPPGIKPKCHKMHITVKQPDTDNKKSKASTGAKVRPKGAMDSGSDISVALGKARSKQSSSELSNAEYEEIRREFCQISKTAKYLPRPQCSILSKNKETQEDSKDLINLSEWTPWQNRLQRAHFTGHASTTHNLVQTCEFIELQQSIGEDANSYGLEMRLYLNKTDVKSSPALNQSIANVSGQSSIKSFFTPSQSSKQGDQSSKINSEKSDVGISKKSEGDAVEQSKKVNKRIKKSKKNGASKSSRTLEQSASNSSALFTSILPVIDKQPFDFDVEMIDIETASDKNVKSVSRHTCDEKPCIQKKGARKKKLLNKEDVVWKDKDTSREPGKCTNKEKNRLKKSRDVDMDVGEEYVFHPKGDKENCKKQSSTNSISRAKIDSFVDDAIEMYDAGQGLLEENSKDVHSHQEHCDSVCMIPSPPRVDEVAKIFESLESPIDFASLDVYQLVVGWDKFGERGELLKSPLRSLTLTSALAEKKNFPAIKFKSRINENVHSATKVNGSKSFSFDKVESGLHNDKQFKVHNVKLSNALMSSSTLGVPESEISIPKLDQEDVIHIESDDDDDVLDNSLKSNGQIPSPEKSNTDKTNELNDASYQYVLSDEGNTEPQPSKDSSITKKLFIDVAHDQISHTTKDSEKSPTCLSNSVNEAMNAIGLDDHPFSPPFSKRKTSQGKLGDTPIKSVSAGNISLATFTQALGCLHSSLLSPTNSTPRKDSSILSPPSEKRIDKPCTENFTNLKPSPSFPVSSTRKGSLPHEVFTSTPVFEKCINNKISEERQSILDTKQNLNSTFNKPAGDSDFDDFGFEDDWCASDIIPPTPPKNNSGTGRSTVTVDTKDKCSQSTFISSRKSNATVQEEQIGKRQPYDKTNPIFSNRLKGSSKLPKNNLNPLQLIGNTALRSDRKRSEPIEPLAQNCSKNEENVPIPFHCGDDSDKALQLIEDTEDCIILSPLSKNQNAVCIEILDSQSQQQPQNSFPSSPPTLHSKHSPEKPQPLPLPLCDTPTTSRTASKSFLSSKKKKKLSLKTAGSSFEEDCHKSRTPAKTKTTSGKVNFSVSSLRSMANGISASTPLAKHLSVKMMDDDYDVVDAMLAMDHLTPIKGITSTPNNDGDVEKSFIIRRKRKPAAVLEESSSDIESGDGRKNSWLCAQRKSDQNESKDSKKDKSKSFEDWQAACLHGVEDEDDFEEMETFSKGKKNPSGRRIERKSRPMKKLKKNVGFVDNEADVSGSDASSDEYDGDGDDCYEGSFINNDTEMMQTQADGTDMRAVYLKSVKSPVHGKYRLQFNHAHNTDIFSQAVTASQGMSEYEEDSFCVGSDEEESPVRKPKKKHMDRRKGNGQKKEKNGKNRRVVCISNSSDEGDDDNGFPFTQEVTTNQRVMAQKALMSSSEDENLSENDKEDGVSRKNWGRMANVLNDTDDAYKDLVTTKAHFSTSTVIESAENHFTQKKNIGDMSALPDLDRGSLSKSNVASKSALMWDGDGAVKTVNVSKMEEWMDDFDAADMNFDSPMLAPQKPSEETQVPNYCKEYESDHPMPGKGKTGLDSIQGSSKNFVRDQSVSGWSSTDQNRDSEYSNTSFERLRASSSVAFVKPMDRNCNETSSIDLVSNNKEDRTNSFYPSENIKNLSGNRDISREERLKRQKEKQERFRQKLAQVQQQQRPDSEVSKVSKHEDELTSKADASDSYVNPALSSLTRASSSSFSTYQSPTITSKTTLSSPSVSNYASNSSNSSVNVSTTAGVETLHILVDSREISGAQDVISTLRLEYNVTVTAKQLASCDYVLSNHLVVDRMCWSAFSNGANRSKLTSRLCEMQTLYRKYAIIVEADKVKVKTGQESNRKCNVFHSKYTDRTMASIIQTGVKMYFTDSAEQTASLLSELCQAERRKGRHLAVPVKLKAQKEGMFNFIMSIPQINIMEALNLVHKYSNLREFVISPVAVLQKRGCFSSEKAQLVYSYLRHGCQLKSRA